MKQFNLANFDEHNGIYQVWLGNRLCVEFGSKRNVRQFLADTNRFLTAAMVELNECYIIAFTQYRFMWFTLMNSKTGTNVIMVTEEQTLQKLIFDTMDQFNRAGNTHHQTSSAWAFIHLQNICWLLNQALEILITINKKRNNTYTYHCLQGLGERIKAIEDKVCNYPEKLPENALSMKSNK